MWMGHFKRQNWQCACAVSRVRVVGGHPKPHIWNQQPQFTYSLYNFYGATTTLKGSLYGSTPIVKRFSVVKFPVKIGPKMAGFLELRGVNINFWPSKTHILTRNCVVWRIMGENRFRGLGCRLLEEPWQKSRVNILISNFAHTGKRNPLRDRD